MRTALPAASFSASSIEGNVSSEAVQNQRGNGVFLMLFLYFEEPHDLLDRAVGHLELLVASANVAREDDFLEVGRVRVVCGDIRERSQLDFSEACREPRAWTTTGGEARRTRDDVSRLVVDGDGLLARQRRREEEARAREAGRARGSVLLAAQVVLGRLSGSNRRRGADGELGRAFAVRGSLELVRLLVLVLLLVDICAAAHARLLVEGGERFVTSSDVLALVERRCGQRSRGSATRGRERARDCGDSPTTWWR